MRNCFICFLVVLFVLLTAEKGNAQYNTSNGNVIWSDVVESSIIPQGAKQIAPVAYRTLSLNTTALKDVLSQVPLEKSEEAKSVNIILSFPLPDGTYGFFSILETPIMEPELAAKFPQIKTYSGQGLDDDTATVRFDFTPSGFHAMIISTKGQIFIDPYTKGNTDNYISYYKKDFAANNTPQWTCEVDSIDNLSPKKKLSGQEKNSEITRDATVIGRSGGTLRTYRAAVAATGEYTAFHGGSTAQGLAAIVTTMNRVTGIYDRELAIRFTLVGNNNLIVYTNANTDPYTNSNASALLNENQNNLDNVIGSANYDVGHVLGTGGGGLAGLGVVCSVSSKARGETGSSNPVGDPFDVDFVAHEIGHQFGGNHTFNGNAGNCSGGNRNGPTAVEPGSGTTIMAYAGICGSQNIQSNSDPFFSTISHDEIMAYVTTGPGTCSTNTATGNDVPVVNAGIGGNTIPINTPFTLTGSATDNHPLTFSWEQVDTGQAGVPNSPSGDAPIFRAFPPSSSPSRTFPAISDIIGNKQTLGEILPTYGRTLHFRLTARDNRANGGGVEAASISVPVSTGAGPFLVTAPNTAVSWTANTAQTITWNVASTNTPPVSCSNVNILLSTDGGNTFPTTILSNTPNDGTQLISVPNTVTSTARIKIEAADNIFFDISNVNFTILGSSLPVVDFSSAAYSGAEDGGVITVTVDLNQTSSQTVTVDYASSNGSATAGSDYTAVSGVLDFTPGQTSKIFTVLPINDPTPENNETVILSLSNASNANLGATNNPSTLTIVDNDTLPVIDFSNTAYSGAEDGGVITVTVNLNRTSSQTVTVNYASSNGTATAGIDYTAVNGVLSFTPGQTSKTFTVLPIDDATVENNETVVLTLSNPSGATQGSNNPATLTITDNDSLCSGPNLSIPDNNPSGVTDTLVVSNSGSLSDLDVFVNVTHSWVGDLVFTLKHVDTGTSVTIIDRPGMVSSGFGCNGNNINATLDDEASSLVENECSGGTPTINGTFQPNNPLSAFDSEDLSGTWTMTISDNVGQDTGTLNTWCIIPTTTPMSTSVWVDFTYTGTEVGTQSQPYNTLAEAINAVTVGGIITIKAGTTNETFDGTNKINKSVTIKSSGGTVIIGKQ